MNCQPNDLDAATYIIVVNNNNNIININNDPDSTMIACNIFI